MLVERIWLLVLLLMLKVTWNFLKSFWFNLFSYELM
jgi:hypothetical protein